MSTDNTTSGNYTLQQQNIDGFVAANFINKLGLYQAGVIQIVSDATFGEGNTFQFRGDVRDTSTWQTPTASTDLNVIDVNHYQETAAVLRRAQLYGIEDLAKIAAGDPTATARAVEILRYNLNYNLTYFLHNSYLPALFDATSGCLRSTHVIDDGEAFNDGDPFQADAIMGENSGMLNTLIMHSSIVHRLRKEGVIDEGDPDLRKALNETGLRYGGMIAGKNVIMDDLCYNSGGVYYTYAVANNAIALAFQGVPVESFLFRDERLAGGTDLIRGKMAIVPHVWGTTYGGTAPTVIGGATDAAYATATNFVKRTDGDGTAAADSEIGIVLIKTTEA